MAVTAMMPPKLTGRPAKYDWSTLNRPSKTRYVQGNSRESLLTCAKNYFSDKPNARFTTRRVGAKFRIYRIA